MDAADEEEENEEKGEELYRGLRAVDLQEAKDLLLIETSDMLNVPLFSAEVLLRQHGNVTLTNPLASKVRTYLAALLM